MHLLNGKTLAAEIRAKIKKEVTGLAKKPGLAVILVGNDLASRLYVSLKEKACLEAGIYFEKHLFLAEATEEELLKKIYELNERPEINGILVQLPLPQQAADKIVAAIDPQKDVDGFHPENLRRLEAGEACLVSPVVLGVMALLKKTSESFVGKSAVLIMGQIFARPFRAVLSQQKIKAKVISPGETNLSDKIKNSDLVITAVGQPNLITVGMIKPQTIIIDIGTTRLGNKVVGDVDAASVKSLTGWLTPVPGGVGPMTVALLLQNVLDAARLRNQPEAKPKN